MLLCLMALSDSDFKSMEQLMRQVVREEAVTKEEPDEKLRHLPSKEEFYDQSSELMKEIRASREEQTVAGLQAI